MKNIRAEKENNVAIAWSYEELLHFAATAAGETWILISVLLQTYWEESVVAVSDLVDDVYALEFEELDDPSQFPRKITSSEFEHVLTLREGWKLATLVKQLPPEEYGATVATCVKAKRTKLSETGSGMRHMCHTMHSKDAWKGLVDDDKTNDDGQKTNGYGANEKDNDGQLAQRLRSSNGSCSHFLREGHRAADCWELEGNAHKRPDWWQPQKETKENDDEAFAIAALMVNNFEMEHNNEP